jgi:hypothetical protein
MSAVSGIVLVKETGLGVPGVLVRIEHLGDDDTSRQSADFVEPAQKSASRKTRKKDHQRLVELGTVATDETGAFALTVERSDLPRHRGLNLVVTVWPPEDPDSSRPPVPLATSTRVHSASREVFVITLTQERLTAAHVSVPQSDRAIETLVTRMRAADRRNARLETEANAIFVERLAHRRASARQAQSGFAHFLPTLSGVSAELRASNRYVAPGESIQAKSRAVMRASIQTRITGASSTGAVALSQEETARFIDESGRFRTNIAAADIEGLLGASLSATLVRRDYSALCRDEPVDPCVLILEGKVPPDSEGTAGPTPEPTESAVPDTSVAAMIDVLLKNLSGPESSVALGPNGRATLEQVNQNVRAFTPHSGPADGPALYDFHHLHIAFEDVWQELFDDDVVTTGQKLYEQFVELGIDPKDYLFGSSPSISGFKQWAKLADDVQLASQGAPPPVSVVSAFEITPAQWNALATVTADEPSLPAAPANKKGDIDAFVGQEVEAAPATVPIKNAQERLIDIAQALNTPLSKDYWDTGNDAWLQQATENRRQLRQQGERIVAHVTQDEPARNNFEQFHGLLQALGQSVKQPYRFTIYAANKTERSLNFGAVVTYRQRWLPVAYQPGRLVKTVPLAPKEVRRFTKKVTIKHSRAEKEVASSLHARKTDTTETTRVETAIVEKAQNKTNFQMSAKGGLKVGGIVEASAQAGASHSASTESLETKKAFREAVLKASEEYKSERSMEITMSESDETLAEESGEISNPNDEIPVTFLFYELQRRFTVSEHIHRLTPVILVAQEFPKPSDIDEDWIVANDWILRRVILDDTFIPAMDYLATKVVGDEVSLQEMYNNLELQRRVTKELKEEILSIRAQVGRRYAALERSIQRRARAIDAEESEGFLEEGVEGLFGSGGSESPEAARVREDAARDAFEREAKLEKEMVARLERETTALAALTESYTRSLSDHLNRKAQIVRLRVHIKSNIMYYMQAIWNHEPPDQRFFRLHEVPVPKLVGQKTYSFEPDPDAVPVPPEWKKPVKLVMKCEIDPDLEFEPLHQVANLDTLLGFKGNYMIFPLKKRNDLTDYMMLPYIDREVGLRDPDELGNWTLTDFVAYVCCLRKELPAAEFTRLMPGLVDAYQRILAAGGGEEEIVVPSDSLFIEALTGAHPLLEDFKLLHRAVDVKKVQAEVRAVEFENLRFAARLREGEREDPTVEKKILVEGGSTTLVLPNDQ